MKKRTKRILFAIVAVVLMCLTACTFTSNLSGISDKMQSKEQVGAIMAELAAGDVDGALKLMHPTVVLQEAENACNQMSTYLAGRKMIDMELTEINIHTSAGTSGKVRQEDAAFKVILDDDTNIYINFTYLSNRTGEGFLTFQIVLGMG